MAVDQPAEPFASSDETIGLSAEISRCDQQHMVIALIWAFLVIMFDGRP